MDERKQFLLKMYDQMWNNISRHINLTGQCVGAVVGSSVLIYFSQSTPQWMDIACSLIYCIWAWLINQIYDSNNWCNRNMAIVSNIERQFLTKSDETEIHCFISGPFKAEHVLQNFKTQVALSISIVSIVGVVHFTQRVFPWLSGKTPFEILVLLPIIFFFAFFVSLFIIRRVTFNKQKEFLETSPGKKSE